MSFPCFSSFFAPRPSLSSDSSAANRDRRLSFRKSPSRFASRRSEPWFPEVFGGNGYKSNQKNRICKNQGVKNEIRAIFLRRGRTSGPEERWNTTGERAFSPVFRPGQSNRRPVPEKVHKAEHGERRPGSRTRRPEHGDMYDRRNTGKRGAESRRRGTEYGKASADNGLDGPVPKPQNGVSGQNFGGGTSGVKYQVGNGLYGEVRKQASGNRCRGFGGEETSGVEF